MKMQILTLNRVEGILPNFSLLDPIDYHILRFIYEKYHGKASLDEIKVISSISLLAPRWKSSLMFPIVRDLIPEELLNAVSSNLAEKELDSRIQKLEVLGLITKTKEFDNTSNELKDMIYLTNVGKMLAANEGVQIDEEQDNMEMLKKVSRSIPQQSRYVINPAEILLVRVNEYLKLNSRSIGIIMPTQNISIFGIRILNNLIIGPFNAIPLLVLYGGYIPITIKVNDAIAYALLINDINT